MHQKNDGVINSMVCESLIEEMNVVPITVTDDCSAGKDTCCNDGEQCLSGVISHVFKRGVHNSRLTLSKPMLSCATYSTSIISYMSMWILIGFDNHNVLNPFYLLIVTECLVKVQDTARSLLHCSHSSHFLLRQP